MQELELLKQSIYNYVDLEVFDEGELYYVIDKAKKQSVIAVCLLNDREKVIFKVKYYIVGDFGISTFDNDKFMINVDTPNLADMRIFPVRLSFLFEPINLKLKILSEVELKMT